MLKKSALIIIFLAINLLIKKIYMRKMIKNLLIIIRQISLKNMIV